jgi:hypothetical protein
LVADQMLHVQAQPQSPLKNPATFKVMGKSLPRVDIPAKVTGGEAYVQDFRPPNMLHARVVRPPSYGASLADVDTSGVESMPGVRKVLRDGNFLAVVAEREFQAVKAMRALAAAARRTATRWRMRSAPLCRRYRICDLGESLRLMCRANQFRFSGSQYRPEARWSRSDGLCQVFERLLDQAHMIEHRAVGSRSVARQNRVDDLLVFVVRAGKASFGSKLRAAKGREPPSQSGRKVGNDRIMSAQIDLRMQREVGVGEPFLIIV